MKNALILGGMALAGYLVYRLTQMNSLAPTPYAYPNNAYSNATLGGQPSEQYPYTAIAPPRVDNQNQPWSASTSAKQVLTSATSNSGGDLAAAANFGNQVSSIASSLTSIWGDLSSTFGWDD